MDERVDLERKTKLLEITMGQERMTFEKYASGIDEIENSLPYNCEHVVPQSWFNKRNPMKGDLHHLFACESRCNSFRSNIPYYRHFADYGLNPIGVKSLGTTVATGKVISSSPKPTGTQ